MKILSAAEQAAFDKPPLFDYKQRKHFFSFPNSLLEKANKLRTPSSQIGFLLLCGYFKATKQFFLPQDFLSRDIEAVANALGLPLEKFSPDDYGKTTRIRHQNLILGFYGFAAFDTKAESVLKLEIATMAGNYLKPKLIFNRCVDFLIQKKIQVPIFWIINELIRSGLQEHQKGLVALMNTHLSDQARTLLDGLFTTPDEQNQYRLTLLKKLSQSTKPSKIKDSIADFETLSELYQQLDSILSLLSLSHTGIQYFAGSVIRSRVFHLKRRNDNDRYIHAAAFIAHQYYRTQDNLVDMFLNVVAAYHTKTTRDHKDHLFEQRKTQQKQIREAVKELDTSVFASLQAIAGLTDNHSLSDTQKVDQIRKVIRKSKTESFEQLKEGLQKAGASEVKHGIMEQQSIRLQNRLSPILKALTFDPIEQSDALMEAIDYFKDKDGVMTDKAPTGFLDKDEYQHCV